jgi:hypothetical protein
MTIFSVPESAKKDPVALAGQQVSTIKNIHRVTVSSTSDNDQQLTIPAVNMAKTVVKHLGTLLTARYGGGGSSTYPHGATATLISETKLRVRSGEYATSNWEVVEYA